MSFSGWVNTQSITCATLTTIACGVSVYHIFQLKKALEKSQKLVLAERKGRTKAERRLRMISLRPIAKGQAKLSTGRDSKDDTDDVVLEDDAIPEDEEFEIDEEVVDTSAIELRSGTNCRPVGYVNSPYTRRSGTPRQSCLISSVHSTLQMVGAVNPPASLEGLENFTHLWLIYIFHQNTNINKESNIVERRRNTDNAPPFQGMRAKITPPRCPELKVGVFSCRSPHRPNPIGLSLAEIVSIDKEKGILTLKGLDLLDGTPVIDIKPYLPQFECHPAAQVPEWVARSFEVPRMNVTWSDNALKKIEELQYDLHAFATKEALCQAISDTLTLDIRSPYQKNKHQPTGNYKTPFCRANLHFQDLELWYHLYQIKPVEEGQPIELFTRVEIDTVILQNGEEEDPVDAMAQGIIAAMKK